MMMTCGHVISKDSFQKLNKAGGYVYLNFPFLTIINYFVAVPSVLIALLKRRLGQP